MNTHPGPARRSAVTLAALFAAMLGMLISAPAYASGGTYNNAEVTISGGNGAALSACVNYAKAMAKLGRPAQSNACKNFASAQGGTVKLNSVTITILQAGSGSGTTVDKAVVDISGGDATAVASCVNYLQGTATAEQTETCKNTANAQGGDVKLKNVDIMIIQG